MRISDLPAHTTPSYLEPVVTHTDGCWMAESGHVGPCRTTRTLRGKYGTAVETTAHWADGTKTTNVRTYLAY